MSKKTFNLILSSALALMIVLVGVLAFLMKDLFLPQEVPATSALETVETMKEETKASEEVPSDPTEANGMLSEYKDYYDQNNDMVGWIRLANTRVNYPVVYREGDGNKDINGNGRLDNEDFYYLRKNFKRQKDIYGIPFVDGRNKLDSNNLIIWGHETDNGTQFHDLNKYRSKEGWAENKVISYDTLKNKADYEVFAAFKDRVYYKNEKAFKFYNYLGSNSKEEFNDYVKNVKEKTAYDTGITPEFGDDLITLVLCDYSIDDGRFVVVARKIKK